MINIDATSRRWTSDEVQSLPSDGHRYEVIGGELCVSPSPGFEHQWCLHQLAVEIELHLRRTEHGICVAAPLGVFLSGDTYVEPDLVVVRRERMAILSPRGLTAAPDLVVEAISPRTKAWDLGAKQRLYEACGVRESWVLDPIERRVVVRVRAAAGLTVAADRGDGVVESPVVLPGFTVGIERLFWNWT